MDSFRKAYGALKDSTKVGLARVNSEFKELDIAIVKATNHVECPPKERHVRKIFQAVSISSPRADVNYCIHALSKRLAKTRCWIARSDTPPTDSEELLMQLPALQQLLYRLVCCQPEGLAGHNFVIQYALALVVKDSFKVYCAINDRIINLVDMYFEMPKDEAVRALNIYKKAGQQADHLAVFYDFCKTLDLAQTFQFPTLRQPPPSFLATMEDYIKEAPETRDSSRRMEDQGTEEEPAPEENDEQAKEVENENKEESIKSQEEPASTTNEVNPPVNPAEEPVDLLGLNEEVHPKALEIEESNALALAIIQPGDNLPPATNPLDDIEKISGWELALVTTPSNMNKPQVAETKMAGGFDKSLLDSLYEDDVARKQLQLHSAGYSTGYGPEMTTPSPFDQHNPFSMSNTIAPPNNMQIVPVMPQQQQMLMPHQQQQQMMLMQQQQNMMMMMMAPHYPYSAQYSQQQMPTGSTNPFGDPFSYPQGTVPQNGQHTLF